MTAEAKMMLDKGELAKMGLVDTPIYLIEYDLPRESRKYTKKVNKALRQLRNKLNFALKYKIRALKNLESSWIIPEDRLKVAQAFLKALKQEFGARGHPISDRRIRIIPVLTTVEGFRSYQDKKVEFLLGFVAEAQETIAKAIRTKTLSDPRFWRIKKAFEIVSVLKDGKNLKRHKQYHQIVDDLEVLDMDIHRMECILEEKRKQEKDKEEAEEE